MYQESIDIETETADFKQYLQNLGYSSSGCYCMPRQAAKFLRWSWQQGIRSLEQINQNHIENYHKNLQNTVSERSGNLLSETYIVGILRTLRLFFDYQLTNETIEQSPFIYLNFRQTKKGHREALSHEQIKALYGVCENLLDKAILALYYGCGLRRMEGILLKVSDIDFAAGMLYVRSGKGRKRRAIPMNSRVAHDLLSYYQLERPKISALFLLKPNYSSRYERGFSPSAMASRMKKMVLRACLPKHFSLHHLRHSIATHLLENGMKVEQVSKFLGHSHLESTQVYTKISSKQTLSLYGNHY